MSESNTILMVRVANKEREAREDISRTRGKIEFCDYIFEYLSRHVVAETETEKKTLKKLEKAALKEKEKLEEKSTQLKTDYDAYHSEFNRLCDLGRAPETQEKKFPEEIEQKSDEFEQKNDEFYSCEAALMRQGGVCLQLGAFIAKFSKQLEKSDDEGEKQVLSDLIAVLKSQKADEDEKLAAAKKLFRNTETDFMTVMAELLDMSESFAKGRFKPAQKGE